MVDKKPHKNGAAEGWPKGYRVKHRWTAGAVVYHSRTGHMPLQDPAEKQWGDPVPNHLWMDMERQNQIYRDRRDGKV